MDPAASELDSSLPHSENPCLIVEDSQPDSVALEDDPESSYRALLARRLSSLQPAACSPVLELIASPPGSRCSQTDSHSENNNRAEPDDLEAADPASSLQEESQLMTLCPTPGKKRFASEDSEMDSGADSTTHWVQSEGGSSHFGFLELSQSQELLNDKGPRVPQSDSSKQKILGELTISSKTSESQNKAVRSEVTSSSCSDSSGQSGRQLSAQTLLHSQNMQDCKEQNQQDHEVLSSQEDLFGAEKSGVAVDSTVSDPEPRGDPTPTPADTLHLLHLSGQGTLVQQSPSQNSADYVSPTPDDVRCTPFIVPNSPTELGEPMDTSVPPEGSTAKGEEPMQTDTDSKPHPSTSTPVNQNSVGLDQALTLPSQPDLSHDVFVQTQTQRSLQLESAPLPATLQLPASPHLHAPLQLSASTEQIEEDSQATQIEELGEPLGTSTQNHTNRSESQAAGASESPETGSERSDPEQKPDGPVKASAETTCPQSEFRPSDVIGCMHESPGNPTAGSLTSPSVISQTSDPMNEGEDMEQESAGMVLALSQSQLLSPEPMEEEDEAEERQDSIVVVPDSGKDSTPSSKTDTAQPSSSQLGSTDKPPVKNDVEQVGGGPSQTEHVTQVADGPKEKSLSDSSGEFLFHFTLPKEGELIGPPVGATPPLVNQLRHSTPIDVAPVASGSAEGGLDVADTADGKLSLRMKLVTPVEEGSSEGFSLQKPALSEEDGSSSRVSSVPPVMNSSPSVFTRVREAHRQQEDDSQLGSTSTPVRGQLFMSPQRCSQGPSQVPSQGPNSQSQPRQQDVIPALKESFKDPLVPAELCERRPEAPNAAPAYSKEVVPHEDFQQALGPSSTFTPSNQRLQRIVPQQAIVCSPPGRGEPESPSFKKTSAPSHRRHVRTIQEVRTTVTRIITDVYYEDGKEVDRRVTEESEEPTVDCQVLDSDISPCRTGSSSLTSGDLADISSVSSKASSLQHSSGGITRPEFLLPPSRGARSASPRRGGGHQQRGQRGQRSGPVLTVGRGSTMSGSPALTPLTPRGRARRGRPPSRSSVSRGGGVGPLNRVTAHSHSSSEEEPLVAAPPRSNSPPEPSSPSDSLRSSLEEASSAGNSFVGLRVVAKWSSNGYFYSGRITKDMGEGRFCLLFDDGYECEVAGKDVLLCDPIPLETEVTALLENQYFSVGVVKGHKTEGPELFYSVERDGQKQWYNRSAIILSLEQGNKLREQHSLGPYEGSTTLTKVSDISLDNLVEGKRRRRGVPGGQNTPPHSSSRSPRTPGTSGKRKLVSSEDVQTPSKRGRRGGGARAVPRLAACNTSGSGTDLPADSPPVAHGPLPQNPSLFMGFAFMLTVSSETDRITNRIAEDEHEDYVQTASYNKKYTESQLQAGGGFILPDFNEEQCKAAYQSLLIADQHCRTRKYLLCLASGVPCVSHIWVRDCCKENKLLNYRNYLLPAGVGPDGAIMEWHPRASPFKSLRALLVFERQAEFWSQLLMMGGASSVRQFHMQKDGSDIPVGKYDIMVTEHEWPPLTDKSATSQEIPQVPAA